MITKDDAVSRLNGAARNSSLRIRGVAVVCAIAVACSHVVGQSTYYMSSSGDDKNTGKSSSTPWQTLSKLNSVNFVTGDQILFKRGEEFYGQIRIDQSGSATPISFGAYGAGTRKAVITAAVHLSGWNVYSGAIYYTQAPSHVKRLICDGVPMTLARYPNFGFLTIQGTNGSTTVTSSVLGQSPGYWQNASVRIRPCRFFYETRVVSGFDGATLTLAQATTATLSSGWGFYLDNKLEELDVPGEWFCDPNTNIVYFYAPGGTNPNGLDVEGGILDYGINSAQSNIAVTGLEFRCQLQAAMQFTGSNRNVRLLDNDLLGAGVYGIRFTGSSSDCAIEGNTIRDADGCGIVLAQTEQSSISNNTVFRIGMVPGHGVSGPRGMVGICSESGSNYTISGNNVDSAGYIGILPNGSYNVVENNVITNTMLKLADGGAIYCYTETPSINFHNTWRHNIIINAMGNTDGAPEGTWKVSNGFQLDNGTYDVNVEKNTVIHAGGGLMMTWGTHGNSIRGNVFYDCGLNPGGYHLFFLQAAGQQSGDNTIVDNVLFPLDSVQTLVMIQDDNSVCRVPGTFDSNYYCSPYNNLPLRLYSYSGIWSYTDLTMERWRAFSGQDHHSRDMFGKLSNFVITDSGATNLIQNGQFQTSIDGWVDWSTNALVSFSASGGMDGGCLVFRLEGGPGADRAAASPLLAFEAGQPYRLRFSIRAAHAGLLKVGTMQAHPPYNSLTPVVPFSIGTDPSDLMCYLVPTSTDAEARVEFRVTYPDTVFYLDKVSLRTVTGTYMSPAYQAPIFVNRTAFPTTLELGSQLYRDLAGNEVQGSLTLPAYSSQILVRNLDNVSVPIQLAAFHADVMDGGKVKLTWSTASETNNYGFLIQRKSAHDTGFVDLEGSFIAGKGTTLEEQGYSYIDSTVAAVGLYSYRLKQVDLDGTIHFTQSVIVQVTMTDAAETGPNVYQLFQNSPNPFNPTTSIEYAVGVISRQSPVAHHVRIVAYDLLGREVKVLVDEKKEPGRYELRWDASGFASGVYICRMTAGEFFQSRTMMLLK
jgi:parallel beta-helix repeat protein